MGARLPGGLAGLSDGWPARHGIWPLFVGADGGRAPTAIHVSTPGRPCLLADLGPLHLCRKLIWDAVDLVVLTALIAVSIVAARARPLERSDWRTALMLVFPVGLLLYPVTNDLQLGQINLVLVLMIVADLVVGVSWRGKRLPRGVLTGLAAALKLTPLIFVPYLLATRQWRAARNMVITFVAATGLMFVVAPSASWLYFTKDAYDVKRVGSELSIGNQTLQAAILRAHLSLPHPLVDLALVLMVGGGIALAAVAYRRSSPLLGVVLCAATGLMVSPISWNHHYVWIVPVLVWLVAGVDRPARGIVWAAAAALIFMWSPAIPPADSNVIWYLRENAYVFATLVFFVAVAAMLWTRRHRSTPSPAVFPPKESGDPRRAKDRRRRAAPRRSRSIRVTSSRKAVTSARSDANSPPPDTGRISGSRSEGPAVFSRRVVRFGRLAGEQLCPALFLLARAAGQSARQRIGAAAQSLELRRHVGEGIEVRHPLRSGPQFPDRLGATKNQDGHDGEAPRVQAEAFVDHLAIPGGGAAVPGMDEAKESSLFQ